MEFLNLRTILFSSIFSISVCTLMIGMLWWMHRHRSRAFAFWIAGYILQCTGVFFIVVRSLIPYAVSVSAGVPLFLAGALFIAMGVECYVLDIQNARRWWINCAWLAFFIAVHVWFALVRDNLPVRTLNYNLGLLFFYGQIVWFLLREPQQDIRSATRTLVVVAGLFVVASVLRIIVELIFPAGGDYFLSGRLNSLFILVDQVLIIWFTFALFLAVNQHLLNDLARDIIERKRSEEEIRKQKEFAENLFHTAPVIVLVLDKSGCIRTFNPYMENLSGYKLAEVKGKDWFQTFLPDRDRARTKQLFDSAVQDISTRGNINPIVGKDGREILVEWYDKTLKDSQGDSIGIIAVGQDFTERKKAEEALRLANVYNRTLIEISIDPLVTIGHDGKILDVNAATEKVTGYSRSQLIGTDFCDYFTDPAKARAGYQQVFKEGTVRDYELALKHKDGGFAYVLYNASVYHDEAGNIIGVFAAARDITQRKQAEDLLRINEKRYRQAESLGHVGNWEYDLHTGHFWGSDEAKRIYGFEPGQSAFSADEVENCIPERERVHQALVDLIERGTAYNLEFEIFPKNSSEPRVISSVAELQRDEQGNPLKVVGVIQDITERKLAEDALRKARNEIEAWNRTLEQRVKEKTEQLLRATKLATVGQLAASVAHELNNPLAGLLSMLGSYRKNVKNNSLEYEEVQAMCYAVEYMTKVVGDLGLFVRESGGVKAKEDLNEILESISSFCLNLMERWKIQIIKEYNAHLLPVVADRRRLQQVFLNMVTNARDAMPKGGTFTIRTGNTPDGKHVFVEFIDTGVGIKNEDLPRLFDPFFTTKDPGRGIGIGLSIAQTIVKEHDGVIRVESSVGRGSRFVITMPAAVP